MKFIIALSMLIAGSAFAKDGTVSCSLTVANGQEQVLIGTVEVQYNNHGTIEGAGYSVLNYVSPICESSQPCTGYRLKSILTKGASRLVIKGDFSEKDSGQVISGELLTGENSSAVSACTVL